MEKLRRAYFEKNAEAYGATYWAVMGYEPQELDERVNAPQRKVEEAKQPVEEVKRDKPDDIVIIKFGVPEVDEAGLLKPHMNEWHPEKGETVHRQRDLQGVKGADAQPGARL